MLSFCFFLVLALTSVRSDVVDINTASDHILTLINLITKASHGATTKIPAGKILYGNESILYSEGTLVGLDTMVRTGDCVMTRDPSSVSFDIHFGYSLLEAFFGEVSYKGKSMPASYRIGDNSLHLLYTFHKGNGCHISLGSLHYERMAKVVVLETSMPELEGKNVDAFFQQYVMPEMDKILNDDKVAVENSLQFLCKFLPGNDY